MFLCGRISGWVSSVPAGITTSRPLRVKCGTGPPHDVQYVVAKLAAVARSNRFVRSSPVNHENCAGATYRFVACEEPVALRQRPQ